MAQLTLRNVKGIPLTYDEMDSNLLALDSDSPWNVSADYITYGKSVGIGPGASSPTYNLDFGTGDSSNEATIGTSNADLSVHVNGPRKLKVTTNSQERLVLTTTGNLGIGTSTPEHPLDVQGHIRASNNIYANQLYSLSFTDSVMSISGGNLTNVQMIDAFDEIRFTELYDKSTGYRIDHIDSVLVNDSNGLPTSSSVYNALDSLNGSLNALKADVTAGNISLANSFTLQGTEYDGSTSQSITFTAGNGLELDSGGTEYSMTGEYTGDFVATGDVTAFSDIAYKEDINPITEALSKIEQIGGYTFRRKEMGPRKYTGVIAQEIQKVLPEAVHGEKDGQLSVAYGNLTGLLIEAVKELTAKVKDLESKLDKE